MQIKVVYKLGPMRVAVWFVEVLNQKRPKSWVVKYPMHVLYTGNSWQVSGSDDCPSP
jgi:hypothetical protein